MCNFKWKIDFYKPLFRKDKVKKFTLSTFSFSRIIFSIVCIRISNLPIFSMNDHFSTSFSFCLIFCWINCFCLCLMNWRCSFRMWLFVRPSSIIVWNNMDLIFFTAYILTSFRLIWYFIIWYLIYNQLVYKELVRAFEK